MNKEVFICSFSNENYLQHFCVMIKSLTKVRNINRVYSVFLFHSDCKEESISKVYNEFRYEKNFNLNFIECNDYKKYTSRLRLNHSSMSIYGKMFIYDLLPSNIKKIAFFDADTILLEDPGILYDTNVDNFIVGAVKDSYYEKVPFEMKKALALGSDDDYFNSGVMIVNLENWRKNEVTQKALNFMIDFGHKTLFHDQDGFNYAINGNWKRISPLWNPSSINTIIDHDGRKIELTAKQIYERGLAKLVHFHGSNKPWLYMSDHIMKKAYLDILHETQFFDYKFPDKNVINTIRKVYNILILKLLSIIKSLN